jgi:ABC-2 type transport system ATP-binding protein
MIEASQLEKSFGSIRALDGVSFAVSEGEIVGLLGPNGSGKTTLIRILTAFFPADAGRATIAGVDLAVDPLEARRRVGYLPERTPLYPEISVERLLRFAADVKLAERRHRSERVAAVIRECSLGDVAHRAIGTLSKGYRQRVGIAQALIGRPHVLILDEPTAGLDPAQVIELRQLVSALGGRTTIVLSSHILADISSVCDRVLILHRGRLVLAERIDALRREVRRSGEVVLRTRAESGAVEALIGAVEGLGVTRIDRDATGAVTAHLTHPQGANETETQRSLERVTSDLARRCVEAGLPIFELGPRSRTLEDMFVELLEEREA